MANKSYGIENLAFRDPTRNEDYLLTRVQGAPSFNMPANMAECSYAFPSELTEMICTDTLRERDNDTYTQTEVDNKFEDLVLDVKQTISKAVINSADKGSINEKISNMQILPGNVVFTKLDDK